MKLWIIAIYCFFLYGIGFGIYLLSIGKIGGFGFVLLSGVAIYLWRKLTEDI